MRWYAINGAFAAIQLQSLSEGMRNGAFQRFCIETQCFGTHTYQVNESFFAIKAVAATTKPSNQSLQSHEHMVISLKLNDAHALAAYVLLSSCVLQYDEKQQAPIDMKLLYIQSKNQNITF